MTEITVANSYLDFFKYLKNKKNLINFYPRNEEVVMANKYDLIMQLYFLRDPSIIDEILFKFNSMETRYYNFTWNIEKVKSEKDEKVFKNTVRFKMKSQSNYQSMADKDIFYLIYSKQNKFILPIGYVKSDFLRKRLKAFFKEFFPKISMSFLTQKEIKQFLSYFTKNKDIKIDLEMLVYRKVREEGDPKKKPMEKAVDYIGAKLIEKISELEANRKYIDTIGLNIYKDNEYNKSFIKFQYNRNNRLLWKKGNAIEIIKLLNNLFELSIKKFEFLDNRERKYTLNHNSRPFVLRFMSDVFSNKEEIKMFQRKIKKFPNSSYTVIHAGNPSLHIILRDQKDNSTFSIRNINNKDLLITPQIKGSNSASLRILDHIAETISEFEMNDYLEYRNEFLNDLEKKAITL